MGTLNLGRVRGSLWYAGNTMSGTGAAETVFPDSKVNKAYVYDMYLNTDTGNVYQCTYAGEPGQARWIYVGSLKGPMADVVNSLDSKSTTKALSANAGRILYQMILDGGLYTKEVCINSGETVHTVKLRLENKDTLLTIEDSDGNTGTYQYMRNGSSSEAEITVSIGTAIGFPEGAVLKSIRSSEACILQYGLYGVNAEELYSEAPSIWGTITELLKSVEESTIISEESEKDSESKATYRTGIVSKLVDRIRTAMFPITHAKAVWWNKLDNRTLYDKITEDCVQYGSEITEEEIDEIIGYTGGTEEPPNPNDEITDQEIDDIIDNLF